VVQIARLPTDPGAADAPPNRPATTLAGGITP
jgi:hypothetical protein